MNLSLDFIASEIEREKENDISIQLNILEINFNRECYVILVNAFINKLNPTAMFQFILLYKSLGEKNKICPHHKNLHK